MGDKYPPSYVKKVFVSAKHILVIRTGYGRSRAYGTYPYFVVYAVMPNGDVIDLNEIGPYWSKRAKAYAMTVWGSDRVFELLYSLTNYDLELTNKIYGNREKLILRL